MATARRRWAAVSRVKVMSYWMLLIGAETAGRGAGGQGEQGETGEHERIDPVEETPV